MKFRSLKQVPVLIAVGVIAVVCLFRILNLRAFDRLERLTYDWRVRVASHFPQPAATNLGFVFISDESIVALNRGLLGNSYGLLWPRHIYGRLIREFSVQEAQAVAFDVLFAQLRVDHASVLVSTTKWPDIVSFLTEIHPDKSQATYQDQGDPFAIVESDDFFAWQLKRAGMGILAAENEVLPHPLFATNALALADISADRDADGVLRRAKAFRAYRRWHPAFKQAEAEYGVDLAKARVEVGHIVLPLPDGEEVKVSIDPDNNFALEDFGGKKLPPGMPPKAKAFADERVWHMGIVVAARELQLDLENAVVNLTRGQIAFRGAGGVERILPVDQDGYIYINWELKAGDRRLTQESIESLLAQDLVRSEDGEGGQTNRWRGKLVVVGSSATGNNMTDRGATPLEKDTLLVSKHWNVANSMITGRFVSRASLVVELLLIALLGALTSWVTWRLKVLPAAGSVVVLIVIYCAAGILLYVQNRYWLPFVLPVIGSMLMQHICLVTYRVVFEQSERRRVKSIFSHMVSPNIVNELIMQEQLPLGGARREITVFFADVRGFTALTDTKQQQAENHVRELKLPEDEAKTFFDEQARETLNTVNLYLTLVADTVKKHEGTLDKYIGDCVMAFWGAPTLNPKHALTCVRAAIDAQRAIHEVNQQRAAQNRKLEAENQTGASARLSPQQLLPTLSLGTGINTGDVTVGLMGSEAHIRNYTVFGREVNLASRLEGVSGHGRIVISETTYQHLLRDDPELAATCVELEPTQLKGFQKAVKNYEVPWLPPNAVANATAGVQMPSSGAA